MSRIPHRVPAGVLLAALCFAASSLAAQQIYKTVDENGNVVYTDRKPSEDAEPVSLPELTVVDPIEIGDPAAVGDEQAGAETADGAAAPGLTILSPQPGATVQNTGYVLPVRVGVDGELPRGAELAYVVDGEVRQRTRELAVDLSEVFRGEHSLSVEIRDPSGSVLSSAGPVNFIMLQHSRLHANPN